MTENKPHSNQCTVSDHDGFPVYCGVLILAKDICKQKIALGLVGVLLFMFYQGIISPTL